MRNSISNGILARLTALMMAAAVVFPTAPASAFQFHGGGFAGGFHGGGMGGFHPVIGGFRPGFGGFHPGFRGFHPAFRPGFAGFRPGFGGRRFFHPGFRRNGIWINGWWGPAVAVGPVAGSYPFWGGGSNCWAYRPAYDAWGNFVGQVYVNLCQ